MLFEGQLAPTKGERLRGPAEELYDVASAYDQPSRTIGRAEALIGRAETVAADIRAVVRGR